MEIERQRGISVATGNGFEQQGILINLLEAPGHCKDFAEDTYRTPYCGRQRYSGGRQCERGGSPDPPLGWSAVCAIRQ